MTVLKLLAAALMLGSALTSASLAQTQTQPTEDVAPAGDGSGTSDQQVTAAGGLVEVNTHMSGETSIATDSGRNSVAGELGGDVNGVGGQIGGGGSVPNLPGLPDGGNGGTGNGGIGTGGNGNTGPGGNGGTSPGGNVASGGTGSGNSGGPSGGAGNSAGAAHSSFNVDSDGDGTISSAEISAAQQFAAGLPESCAPVDLSALRGNTPELIRAVSQKDRIDLVLLCAADGVLDDAQMEAIRNSRILRSHLAAAGFGPDDVVGVSLDATASGSIYVLARSSM